MLVARLDKGREEDRIETELVVHVLCGPI